MATVANRLIAYGAVTCLAGILFSMMAAQLVGLLYEALPPQTVIAGVIIDFVSRLVGVCLAPLGTALIAVGIALRMLDHRFDLTHLIRTER
ncbi:hypothetical protein AVL61_16265 [Kocuria rosea subsp. polaris]|uniref:Major facilitator superfamily (MFS) profile domain-containing protein n=1 Tax=Kocuria rosea subsp. polaris TaxID=136273 RepID=A0A0W8IQV0_KOCRO|nr:hypothetical protein [Kocuria polaris]KUG62297.1 hypothetical protein AVL61_16265 [Kocuria polaris]